MWKFMNGPGRWCPILAFETGPRIHSKLASWRTRNQRYCSRDYIKNWLDISLARLCQPSSSYYQLTLSASGSRQLPDSLFRVRRGILHLSSMSWLEQRFIDTLNILCLHPHDTQQRQHRRMNLSRVSCVQFISSNSLSTHRHSSSTPATHIPPSFFHIAEWKSPPRGESISSANQYYLSLTFLLLWILRPAWRWIFVVQHLQWTSKACLQWTYRITHAAHRAMRRNRHSSLHRHPIYFWETQRIADQRQRGQNYIRSVRSFLLSLLRLRCAY